MLDTTPAVEYARADGSNNTIRLETVTYPNGRRLHYSYGQAADNNNFLSRVAALLDDDGVTHLVDYRYVGLNAFAVTEYPSAGLKLSYADSSEGALPGWDRFGRVVDHPWVKNGTPVEQLQFGYDRSGNRLYRRNVVAGGGFDELYTYDGLNQITRLQRGTLNNANSGLVGTPSWQETFEYDSTGNWDRYSARSVNRPELDQNRIHSKANELVGIDSSSSLLGYDSAGNMTKSPHPDDWSAACEFTWDAWNRLVRVLLEEGVQESYEYDGLARRTTISNGSTGRHIYYSAERSILEERVDVDAPAHRQFIWGERSPNDLVLRDEFSENSTASRLFSLNDGISVTAVAGGQGVVEERYMSSAFGSSEVLSPEFVPRLQSDLAWETRFGSYRLDLSTGLYSVDYRCLHSTLGRWLSRDPVEESENLYAYAGNNPLNKVDPSGLAALDVGNRQTPINCAPNCKPVWFTCDTSSPGKTLATYCKKTDKPANTPKCKNCANMDECCQQYGKQLGTPAANRGDTVCIIGLHGPLTRTVDDCGCGQTVANKPNPDNWMDFQEASCKGFQDGWRCVCPGPCPPAAKK